MKALTQACIVVASAAGLAIAAAGVASAVDEPSAGCRWVNPPGQWVCAPFIQCDPVGILAPPGCCELIAGSWVCI